MRRRIVLLVVSALAAVACADDGGERAGPTSTSGSATSAPLTAVTTTTAVSPPTTVSPLSPIDGCPVPGPLAVPDPDRPVYRGEVHVDMDGGRVTGRVAVRFVPDLAVTELVFRLWPNSPALAAAGTSATVAEVRRLPGGEPVAAASPDPTTLVVATGPLAAGDAVEVELDFEVVVGGATSDRVSLGQGALRLGSYVPLLAWEPGTGWAREPPTSLFAEAVTSPTADFELSITASEGYDLLASGRRGDDGVWRATAVRDVALSAGRFRVATATVQLPADVAVTVGVDQAVDEDPQAYLDRVVAALADFAARYGAYPWSTFSLAITPGLNGGIEFPTHVMQGPDTIGRTTPHEVGHMWFYSLVGNDQGRDPWLDEALASFAEFVHTGTLGEAAARDIPADAEGRGGEPMTYWEEHRTSYYRGVYLQPAVAMAELGDPAMVDCALRQYVAAMAFGIATPADLFAALGAVFPDAEARLAPAGLHP